MVNATAAKDQQLFDNINNVQPIQSGQVTPSVSHPHTGTISQHNQSNANNFRIPNQVNQYMAQQPLEKPLGQPQ